MEKVNSAPSEERVDDETTDDEILEKATGLFADVFVIAIDELVERKFLKGSGKERKRKR